MKLGHVHIKVSELERAEKFYTNLLELKVTERVGNHYIFLTFGKAHHDLALQNVGPDAPVPPEHSTGLYHVAYEVDNIEELKKLYKKLTQAGIPMSPVDHGISKAIYFSDPDGNGIEVYVDSRHRRRKWQGKSGKLEL